MRLILPLLLVLMSCGSIQKLGLRSTSPLFKKAGDLTVRERNWKLFRESSPGNLKLMELLYLEDTENETLLQALVKGYAGYAFGVFETLALEDELSGSESTENHKDAISFYTRSLDYGLEYLGRHGIRSKDLLALSENELLKKFNDKLDADDYAVLLYTGQAWGGLINLQKDNMTLVSHVPKVKMIFDWVCKKDPQIENGICDIFFAQYEASRPKMLGGDPDKAKVLYGLAMEKYPKNQLIRLGYIQFMILPMMDGAEYEKEAGILKKDLAIWDDLNRDDLVNRSPYRAHEDLNLFNAVAKKRLEIIEKYKTKIF